MANNTSIQSAEGAKLCKTRQPAAFLYGRRSWPWYRQKLVWLSCRDTTTCTGVCYMSTHSKLLSLLRCIPHIVRILCCCLPARYFSCILIWGQCDAILLMDVQPLMWKYINGESALTCQRDQPSPKKNIAVAPGCSGISILDTAGDLN